MAPLVVAVVGIALVAPLLTAVLVHHLLRRSLAASAVTLASLGNAVRVLREQQDTLAERQERLGRTSARLLARLETTRRQDAAAMRSHLAAQRDAIGEIRDELKRHTDAVGERLDRVRADHRRGLAGHRASLDDMSATLRALARGIADQYTLARDALNRAPSSVLIHTGFSDPARALAAVEVPPDTAVIDLDDPSEADEVIRDVDTAVVLTQSVADLRATAARLRGFSAASRVLVVVVRSARELPFPSLQAPVRIDVIKTSRFHRGQTNGWVYDVTLTRAVPIADVIGPMVRTREMPAVAAGRTGPDPVAAGDAIDIGVINPIGFRTDTPPDVGVLRTNADGVLTIALSERILVTLRCPGRLNEADIAALRPLRAVLVDHRGDEFGRPDVLHAATFGLAAAGVPLVCPTPQHGAIHPAFTDLVSSATVERLDDALAREEYSIRLRRSALRLSRATTAAALSVLLCTKRPAMIQSALEQIAGQRGVDFEVVLGLHGVDVDAGQIRRLAETMGLTCTVREVSAELSLGHALNQVAAAATGSILAKMDDDDLYGPDHLSDLLLARSYSSADIVGCAAEFIYLEGANTTIRRSRRSEVCHHPVGGGSILVDRLVLESVGGFRDVASGEDRLLQRDVSQAGGLLYRSHGLGYVIRRHGDQHTWRVDAEYFTRGATQSWPGLHLSGLFDSRTTHPRTQKSQ